MSKLYLRCYVGACNKLLLKDRVAKGLGCECGNNKFRGVSPDSEFTDEEQKLIKEGKAAVVDTAVPGIEPDVLNFKNEHYWKRLRKQVSKGIYDTRYERAKRMANNG